MQENKNLGQIPVFQYCYEHKKICCKHKTQTDYEKQAAACDEILNHIKNKKEKEIPNDDLKVIKSRTADENVDIEENTLQRK